MHHHSTRQSVVLGSGINQKRLGRRLTYSTLALMALAYN